MIVKHKHTFVISFGNPKVSGFQRQQHKIIWILLVLSFRYFTSIVEKYNNIRLLSVHRSGELQIAVKLRSEILISGPAYVGKPETTLLQRYYFPITDYIIKTVMQIKYTGPYKILLKFLVLVFIIFEYIISTRCFNMSIFSFHILRFFSCEILLLLSCNKFYLLLSCCMQGVYICLWSIFYTFIAERYIWRFIKLFKTYLC